MSTTSSPTTFAGRSLVSIGDLTREEILQILELTEERKHVPAPDMLRGKVLATAFFEPSTRTRLSFEAAMVRLGGSVVGFSDGKTSSSAKGESLSDEIRVLGSYADALVIRHPLEGSARQASRSTDKPVINGGDGANQHPTQTLLDLFTIRESQGTLENLRVALVGDLKHGRTVHSLAEALVHFGVRLYMVAPEGLELPDDVCDSLRRQGVKFSFHPTLEDVISKVDVLYMTRTQKERFSDPRQYERVKGGLILTPELLEGAKENLRVMHPLPRLEEIHPSVDQSPHALYFEQAANGIPVRQAILQLFLGA